MASEIKVDTISEKTAANGVTIDGVNIKDSALATAGSVPLSTIDIDGGTDIGAAIVDADLFIIDDGAGGTNRKVAASRIKTYAGGSITALNNATANELVTIGSTTTELDAEANLTFSGSALQCTATLTVGVDDTGHDVKFFGATASSHMLWDESADALNLVASTLGVGTVGTKDLGVGIHIKTGDSGASAPTNGDELIIEGSTGSVGMTILSATDGEGKVNFGDSGDNDIGRINYNHPSNYMTFFTSGSEAMRIDSIGAITKPLQPAFNAHSSPAQTVGSTSDTTVVLGTEVFDQNADFASNTFTAPVTGRYQLNGLATVTDLDDEYCYFQIITSNRTYGGVHQVPSTSGAEYEMMSTSCLADMDAGDTAYLNVNSESDTSFDLRGGECEFTGFLAC